MCLFAASDSHSGSAFVTHIRNWSNIRRTSDTEMRKLEPPCSNKTYVTTRKIIHNSLQREIIVSMTAADYIQFLIKFAGSVGGGEGIHASPQC